jgi:hypothetical protein
MQRGRGYRGRGGRPYNHGRGSFSNNRGCGSYFSPDTTFSSRLTCQICGKPGHIALHCYHQQDMSFSDQQQQQFFPQAYYSSPILPAKETWYPDTRATHHMTNEL